MYFFSTCMKYLPTQLTADSFSKFHVSVKTRFPVPQLRVSLHIPTMVLVPGIPRRSPRPLAYAFMIFAVTLALEDGLVPSPPRGWSSWYAFLSTVDQVCMQNAVHCNISVLAELLQLYKYLCRTQLNSTNTNPKNKS